MNTSATADDLIAEAAEIKKQRFLKFVDQLALLRDLQYENNMAPLIAENAKRVVALNLPSNLLRAAAIFVDYFHGFPANKDTFGPPEWVTNRKLLPEGCRGSLVCTGFSNVCDLTEEDVVVLIDDLPKHGLHAGMAGIIRELSDDEEPESCLLVEFGDPEDCITQKVQVSAKLFRRPRPGDLMENFRR
jgi:hypothetical protein